MGGLLPLARAPIMGAIVIIYLLFGDDDGYINKGGMDYYVFWDKETNRVTPIEYDGNSAMGSATATWTPFYNATNANFAIQNKLFNVPALRQRYLAHVRTMIEEDLDTAYCLNKLNRYAAMIDTVVQNDPIKNYSYAQWQTDKTALRTFFINRKTAPPIPAKKITMAATRHLRCCRIGISADFFDVVLICFCSHAKSVCAVASSVREKPSSASASKASCNDAFSNACISAADNWPLW